MNRDEHRKTFLEKNDDPIERNARLYMLDAVACEMHNEGYSLDGNTEESDIRWFARLLYDRDDQRLHWDNAGDETRGRYLRLAETCMEAIPALMGRMSARCIRISKAVNTIIKAEKLNLSEPSRPAESQESIQRLTVMTCNGCHHLLTDFSGYACNVCGHHCKAWEVAESQSGERVCVKCGHSNVNSKGECRQCIDWQKHECVFKEEGK